MFHAIHKNVTRFASLSAEELERFNAHLELRHVPRKTMLLRAGEHCRFEAYVVKGLLRTYMLDADGAEVVLTFAAEDWWVSDVSSFCEGTASQMFIETLEDSELLILTPESKEAALREIPALERVFRLLLQRHLSRWQTRFYEHLAVSATERYLAFAARYPVLIQRLPQHQIAAYLGIAPESLSRLRKKLSEKH